MAVDLVENGGSVPLTQVNKQQYVDLYVEHLLLKSVEKQRKAFCRGFHKVGSWPPIQGSDIIGLYTTQPAVAHHVAVCIRLCGNTFLAWPISSAGEHSLVSAYDWWH